MPLVGLALLLLATAALAAEPFRHLKTREILTRFTGMELTDGVHWAYVFEKAGGLTSFSMSKVGTGRWQVAKNELCLDRAADGRRCFEVWMSGNRVELRHEPALPQEGVLQPPRKRG